MNKELDPLEAFDELHCTAYGMKAYDSNTIKAEKIIETVLKDYEKQEETKYILLGARYNGKTANLRALIKLKAFEVIKEKRVNVLELSTCANYETYLAFFNKWNWNGEYDKYILTQEEYDLLKEVLL